MFLAGIDGGGTSTRLEIRDGCGQTVKRERFGPFNISAIGEQAFRQRMRQVFAACGDMRECVSLCVGGAGVSSYQEMGSLLASLLAETGFSGRLTLKSDFEIALRGAMDGPGCILIAGTGSVGYGRNPLGECARVGGYGHLIDDEGSGYAIGRDALSAAVRMEDGRLAETPLKVAVYQAIHAEDIDGLLRFVYYSGTDKAAVAAVAETVMALARDGDEAALAILRAAAAALCRMVNALAARLSMPRPPLALLGGLFEHETLYGSMVREALAPHARLLVPAHDALWGAAQLAEEAVGGERPSA